MVDCGDWLADVRATVGCLCWRLAGVALHDGSWFWQHHHWSVVNSSRLTLFLLRHSSVLVFVYLGFCFIFRVCLFVSVQTKTFAGKRISPKWLIFWYSAVLSVNQSVSLCLCVSLCVYECKCWYMLHQKPKKTCISCHDCRLVRLQAKSVIKDDTIYKFYRIFNLFIFWWHHLATQRLESEFTSAMYNVFLSPKITAGWEPAVIASNYLPLSMKLTKETFRVPPGPWMSLNLNVAKSMPWKYIKMKVVIESH